MKPLTKTQKDMIKIISDATYNEIKLSIRKSKEIIEEINKKMRKDSPLTFEEIILSRPKLTSNYEANNRNNQ